MQGDAKIIEHLNKALREELQAISQYFVHAEMCHNWGYHKLGSYIRKQSIDEMKHAEALIERILFLDATPAMEPLPLKIGQSVRQQLESDLGLEAGAVRSYNEAVRVARDVGDNASRALFEKILKDEEGHVDWLEAQIHLIGEVGYERYLSQQIGGGND
jgi:bacterioferritin